jgi:hypothetical protein
LTPPIAGTETPEAKLRLAAKSRHPSATVFHKEDSWCWYPTRRFESVQPLLAVTFRIVSTPTRGTFVFNLHTHDLLPSTFLRFLN